MKQILKMQTVFTVIFSLSLFLIASNVKVAASGRPEILPTHTGFIDTMGYYRIVGEVENIGDRNVHYIQVNATFYNVENIAIASHPTYSLFMLDVLLPGRKAPFEIVLANKTTAALVDHYSLNLSAEEYLGERPLLLQILQSTTYIEEGIQKVNGTVKNLAMVNATYVKVVATFYSAQGKVVGTAYDYTMPSTVMPGRTEPFELELKQKAGDISKYSLTAESLEYAAVSEQALSVGFILINNGANYTTTTSVTLTLSANGTGFRIAQMCFSNDNMNFTEWETYAAYKLWTLKEGDGEKAVYVQYKDTVGLISPSYSDTIILDTTPPALSIISPVNNSEIKSSGVVASWEASDETSDISHYEIRLDDSLWIHVGTNQTHTFTGLADGSHTISVRAIDKAGTSNQSSVNFTVNTSSILGSGFTEKVVILAIIIVATLVIVYFLRKH